MAELTPRQAQFVREYLIDLNATQAAIRAGYSAKSAGRFAVELLSKTHIQAAVTLAQTQRAERTEITADRVLRELARIAFFDPRKMFDKDGRPLSITELDDDTAAAIAGLEVSEEFETVDGFRQKVGEVKKWKLSAKHPALELLGKHVGIVKDGRENPNVGITINVQFGDDPIAEPSPGSSQD